MEKVKTRPTLEEWAILVEKTVKEIVKKKGKDRKPDTGDIVRICKKNGIREEFIRKVTGWDKQVDTKKQEGQISE
jgi:hypothetical protein